jgi:cyanate permease
VKNKMWRNALNLLIMLSVVALVYSLIGVLQTGMLSGAPNYSRIRAEHNERLWTSMSAIFFGLSALLIYLRVRR